MYNNEFNIAKLLAKEVGQFLLLQTSKTVDLLEGKDIKLELDKISEKKILEVLEDNFDHPILSEESGVIGVIGANMPYWIIDPIDGTMNYSRDFPFACVSIALWVNDEPLLGVVYDFYRDEIFSGLVGIGAWLNDKPISAPNVIEKSEAILATGFPTYMDFSTDNLIKYVSHQKEYKKIRMLGSAALSICYVACGRVDGYLEESIKLWDVAAGVAICKSLGVSTYIKRGNNYDTNTKVGV